MSFCAICKRNPDPNIGCFDGTGQVLRNMGIERKDKNISKDKLKKNSYKAIWFILLFLLIALIIGITVALIYTNG